VKRYLPGAITLGLLLAALLVRSGIVFAMVVLVAIFVPMEKLFALHPRPARRDRWKTDAVHFVVNNMLIAVGLIVALVIGAVALHWAVNPSLQAAVASQPWWIQFVEAVLLADLAQYWAHRATHQVPFLWRFHKVHHSIEEMDWLAAGRLHPIDSVFTRAVTILPLYLLGFTRATFGAYLVVTAFQAIFIHANVRFRFGPLRWVTATPEFHHWHHANEPEAVNKNFAGNLPLLDVVFGTCHLPGSMPSAYGMGEAAPRGYAAQLAWPFRDQAAMRADTDARSLSTLMS
jgi:sterol desaturase/sphingolipid hydroxylase (fatty acid hydroxylase superfamily)